MSQADVYIIDVSDDEVELHPFLSISCNKQIYDEVFIIIISHYYIYVCVSTMMVFCVLHQVYD